MHETWTGRWKVWARGGSNLPPLLLLHGFTGDAESWREVVARLHPGRTVITLTLPGHEPPHKRSGLANREPDFDSIADRLVAELEEVAVAPWEISGYSMGARVALAMIVRHPDRFSRATLISVHPGLEATAERRKRAAEDRHWAEILERDGLEAFVDAWEKRPLFSTQDELNGSAIGAQRSVRVSHDAHGLAWAMRHLGLGAMPGYLARLGALELPVEIVAGALDAKFTRIARRIESKLAGARLTIVPGCGHNVVIERPDVVAALLEGKEPDLDLPRGRRTAARHAALRRSFR